MLVDFFLEVLQPLLVVVEHRKHPLLRLALVELLHGYQSQLLVRKHPSAKLSAFKSGLLFGIDGGALVGSRTQQHSLVVVYAV